MLTLHCPPGQVFALADFLREKGAQAISVSGIDYVFTQDNPLFDRLTAGL
jgi:ATP phosphoribosyltransferase